LPAGETDPGAVRGTCSEAPWKSLRFGSQLVSLGGGVRYWVESPDGGAEGFGFRMTMTLLFPR
jgi:hypothetical protein